MVPTLTKQREIVHALDKFQDKVNAVKTLQAETAARLRIRRRIVSATRAEI
jgi:hypothetical protein